MVNENKKNKNKNMFLKFMNPLKLATIHWNNE